MYVVNIEGSDGVGKESITKELVKLLSDKGYRVDTISFPRYDKEYGKAIREMLYNKKLPARDRIYPEVMTGIYSMDRLDYFLGDFINKKEELDFLIVDRSFYSNYIYQFSKLLHEQVPSQVIVRWFMVNYITEIEQTKLNDIENFHTFVIHMDKESRNKQLNSRETVDAIESNLKYSNIVDNFIMISKEGLLNRTRDSLPINIAEYYFDKVSFIEATHQNSIPKIKQELNRIANSIINQITT